MMTKFIIPVPVTLTRNNIYGYYFVIQIVITLKLLYYDTLPHNVTLKQFIYIYIISYCDQAYLLFYIFQDPNLASVSKLILSYRDCSRVGVEQFSSIELRVPLWQKQFQVYTQNTISITRLFDQYRDRFLS